ncbi:MAG TPA: ATP-binding protein [Rubricoccaceae bacterium]|jgi:anti-sigma regulatory factor (Ser/Thr protein kinase)
MPSYSLAPGADLGAVGPMLDRVERDVRASGLPTPTVDRIVLVAGELLANAVEHGGGGVALQWEPSHRGGTLWVGRGGGEEEAIRGAHLPDPSATRGRGLYLVQRLSDELSEAEGGLVVGFTVRAGEET